jgi:hypothetical protein
MDNVLKNDRPFRSAILPIGLRTMIVRYRTTLEDLVAFNRYHCAHSPAVKKTKFTCMILVSALLIAGSLFIAPTEEVARPVIVAVAIVFAGLFSVVFNYMFTASMDRQARRLYNEGTNKGTLGQHELEIDDNGLVERTEVNETRQSWHGVERIAETDERAFIYVSSMMAVPPQNLVDRTIVDVSALSVKLTYPNASLAVRPARDRWNTENESRAVGNARKGPSSVRVVTFAIIAAHISRWTTF